MHPAKPRTTPLSNTIRPIRPPRPRPITQGLRIVRAPRRWRRLAAVCGVLLLAACERAAPPLPNDAYVWQRQWTPALVSALAEGADAVRSWRVLAAELRADGAWFDAAPDLAALAASQRPVVLVLRLDGRVNDLRDTDIADRAAAALAAWRQAGVTLAGLEIDYDCAISKLPAYGALLATLKTRLGANLPLSITGPVHLARQPRVGRLAAGLWAWRNGAPVGKDEKR